MALGDAWKQISWFYYQYLLITALYMLEPWERTVFRPYEEHYGTRWSILQILFMFAITKILRYSIAEYTWYYNSLLITVAAMAVYTGYVFMPQHIMAILHYFEVVQ